MILFTWFWIYLWVYRRIRKFDFFFDFFFFATNVFYVMLLYYYPLYTTHKFIAPHWNISVTNTVLCGWLKHVLLFYLACGKLQNSCTQQFWPRVMQTLWAHIVASTALKTSRYPLVQHITLDSALSPSAHRHHRLKEISHSAHCSDSLVGLHRYMGYCSSSHTLA